MSGLPDGIEVERPVRDMQKLTTFVLITALILGSLSHTAACAGAANATATPAPRPAGIFAPANNSSGSVTGTVFDATGNLVPNADVYLYDGQGIPMGLTASDHDGMYRFTDMDPGNYALVVQVDGFAWYKQFAVGSGAGNVTNIYIPDYVHYPRITPLPAPAPAANNTTQKAGKATATIIATPEPTQKNKTAGNSTGNSTGRSGSLNSSARNSTAEAVDGQGSGDILGGIIAFFKSLFGQ